MSLATWIVEDKHLELIAQNCSRLQHLSIRSFSNRHAGLSSVADHCKQLKRFECQFNSRYVRNIVSITMSVGLSIIRVHYYLFMLIYVYIYILYLALLISSVHTIIIIYSYKHISHSRMVEDGLLSILKKCSEMVSFSITCSPTVDVKLLLDFLTTYQEGAILRRMKDLTLELNSNTFLPALNKYTFPPHLNCKIFAKK